MWARCHHFTKVVLCLGLLPSVAIVLSGPARIARAEDRAIAIRVVDSIDRPVQGAAVEVLSNFRPVASATTDSDGRAVLTLSAETIVQWIVALKPFAGMDYYEAYPPFDEETLFLQPAVAPPALPAAQLPETVTLRLEGARTIRFGFTDSADAPVPGVRVVPWLIFKENRRFPANLSGSEIAAATTLADDEKYEGLAWFEWIPLETRSVPGTTFLIDDPGWYWPIPKEDVYPGSHDLMIHGVLAPKVEVSGTVVTNTGAPATGALVIAEGRAETINYGRVEARTDDRGRFQMRLPSSQEYSVVATLGDTIASQSVIVGSASPAKPMELQLGPGIVISGVLATAEGPIPDHLIWLATLAPGEEVAAPFGGMWAAQRNIMVRQTRSGDNGEFEFLITPGEYQLFAITEAELAANPRRRFHRPEKFVIPAGSPARVRADILAGGPLPHLQFAGPVQSSASGLRYYLLHPATLSSEPNRQCAQCHTPAPAVPMRIRDVR